VPIPKHRRLLGENIRAQRKRLRLSQEKLAEKADLHPVYIGDIERGEENVSLDSLVRIAKALKMPLRDLVQDI
jgi:transcriptional regulator with XRE-family HTH domain